MKQVQPSTAGLVYIQFMIFHKVSNQIHMPELHSMNQWNTSIFPLFGPKTIIKQRRDLAGPLPAHQTGGGQFYNVQIRQDVTILKRSALY